MALISFIVTLHAEPLNHPSEEREVKAAIASMKTGKSPGSDGLPFEYNKKSVHIVAPVLSKVYAEAFEVKCLPNTFMKALIILLSKKRYNLSCELQAS